MNQTMLSLSQEELEALIRRVVREELSYLLRVSASSLLEDLRQEGPDDSAEDDLLLQESLKILQKYRDKPGAWMKWEDLEKELDQAEAGGELPD